jgi:ABC-type antimicrobial peptide transport system permease subunit
MFLGAGFVVFGFFLGLVGAGVGLLLAFFSLIFALKAAFPWAREHELADEARRGWAVRGRLQAMNPDQAGRLLAEERDGLLYGEGPTGAMLDRRRELRERLLE